MWSEDVPALLVRASALQLRDAEAIERYTEEWLANLPKRSLYLRWRYAISLLTRGASATRVALRCAGQDAAAERFQAGVLVLGYGAILGGLTWCLTGNALWPRSDQPPPVPYVAADLATRCLLIASAGALSWRRPPVRLAFIVGLYGGPAAQLALAPVFPALARVTGTAFAGLSLLANVSTGLTAVFVAVGVAFLFDRSLQRSQRTVAVIYMGLLGALYETGFGVSWCTWLVGRSWWPIQQVWNWHWLPTSWRMGVGVQILEAVLNAVSSAFALLALAATLVVVVRWLRLAASISSTARQPKRR